MKKIFNHTLFLACFACMLITSCKQNDDLMTYDTKQSFIYFGLPFQTNQYGTPLALRVDSLSYTYALELPTVVDYTFKIPVNIAGMPSDKDREYTIQIDGTKTTAVAGDYDPIPSKQVIRKGRVVDTISVTVHKTPAMDKAYRNIVINLVPNDQFKLGTKEYLTAKLSFTNLLPQPAWWKVWQGVFGTYSKEKYLVWRSIYKKGLDPTPNYSDPSQIRPYYWQNMPTYVSSSTYAVTFMYIKQMQDYLLANPTYVDNDPTKERILIPYAF